MLGASPVSDATFAKLTCSPLVRPATSRKRPKLPIERVSPSACTSSFKYVPDVRPEIVPRRRRESRNAGRPPRFTRSSSRSSPTSGDTSGCSRATRARPASRLAPPRLSLRALLPVSTNRSDRFPLDQEMNLVQEGRALLDLVDYDDLAARVQGLPQEARDGCSVAGTCRLRAGRRSPRRGTYGARGCSCRSGGARAGKPNGLGREPADPGRGGTCQRKYRLFT